MRDLNHNEISSYGALFIHTSEAQRPVNKGYKASCDDGTDIALAADMSGTAPDSALPRPLLPQISYRSIAYRQASPD
jgi:hypothetical protein